MTKNNVTPRPYRADLRQQEVISLDRGHHLVLASAGCGKTAILAQRVRRALENGVKPEDMLCLTFTNRAARGMRSRIRETAGEASENLFVGNIHRYCSRFVYDNHIISQSSAIMDEEEAFSVISSVSDFLTEGPDAGKTGASALDFLNRSRLTALMQLQHLMMQYRLRHPRGVIITNRSDYIERNSGKRYFSPEQFRRLCLDAGKEVGIATLLELYDHADRLAESREFTHDSRELLRLMKAAKSYEKYKTDHNLIDFDDLLILTYSALDRREEEYKRYGWIQIDEVQDLNPLQFAIIDRLTRPDNVTVYLGDEQQAIFSFIGAKLSTLNILKKRCEGNIHNLDKCYRSPKYLLDVFNDYAEHELEADRDFLPEPADSETPEYGDLTMYYANTSKSAVRVAGKLARSHEEGRTAILVSTNQEADSISMALKNVPHFKISGTDLFSLPQTKLLLAHINVLNDEVNYLAWARILHGLNILPSYTKAREFVIDLKSKGMTPADFIKYPGSAYALEFLESIRRDDYVIFDTETTGLDVYEDDIVQLAATRYRDGEAVGSLNILLHTDRKIPERLGDLKNPLVEEYALRPHLSRSEGLRKFLDFASGAVLIGHNVDFDYNILDRNCRRSLTDVDIVSLFPKRFDTLKLSRLLLPKIRSYTLASLISEFNLQGENSHLADADIEATRSLLLYLIGQAEEKREEIIRTVKDNAQTAARTRERYGSLYLDASDNYYERIGEGESPLINELQRAYGSFLKEGMKRLDKFDYIVRFLEKEVVEREKPRSLYEEISRYVMDLNTFKEADLCGSDIVEEKIFVATVHKAKGLEFDNVIVFGCVDGTYPFFATQYDPDRRREDARKLYVAITRAMKRLYLLAYDTKIVNSKGNAYRFNANASPFLSHILRKHNFITIHE